MIHVANMQPSYKLSHKAEGTKSRLQSPSAKPFTKALESTHCKAPVCRPHLKGPYLHTIAWRLISVMILEGEGKCAGK